MRNDIGIFQRIGCRDLTSTTYQALFEIERHLYAIVQSNDSDSTWFNLVSVVDTTSIQTFIVDNITTNANAAPSGYRQLRGGFDVFSGLWARCRLRSGDR